MNYESVESILSILYKNSKINFQVMASFQILMDTKVTKLDKKENYFYNLERIEILLNNLIHILLILLILLNSIEFNNVLLIPNFNNKLYK